MLERFWRWWGPPDPDRPPIPAFFWVAMALLAYLVSPLPKDDGGFYLKISDSGIELALGGAIVGRSRFVPPAEVEGSWTWPATTSNTGVPAGTSLTTYSGPCTITTPDTVISEKTVNCSPLDIQTTGVVVERSVVNGGISVGEHLNSAYDDGYQPGTDPAPNPSDPEFDYNGTGPTRVTVTDSELLATGDFRPIGVSHYEVIRTTMTEGHSGGECHNAGRIYRSYARGFGEHASGFRMYRHCEAEDSTFWCEPNPESDEDQNGIPDPDGGCSADVVMYAQVPSRPNDEAWPGNLALTNNLFKATLAYWCIRQDGRSGDGNFVFIDNVGEIGNGVTHGANCGQSSMFDGFESGSTTGSSGNRLASPPDYVGGTPVSPE